MSAATAGFFFVFTTIDDHAVAVRVSGVSSDQGLASLPSPASGPSSGQTGTTTGVLVSLLLNRCDDMGNEILRRLFSEYGIWRLSEIFYTKMFPALGGLVDIKVKLRRRVRNEGVSVREAKEIFFLDMVLTSLYVLPLLLATEAVYQFSQIANISNFERDYYYAWWFLFCAPAIGVTFVMAVESARAVAIGVIKGNRQIMFALGRNSYAAIHLISTSVVVYAFLLNMFRFYQ